MATNYDQAQADQEAKLDALVNEVRASRARKAQRHPDFVETLAVTDTYKSLVQAGVKGAASIAAVALHRLAQMEDFVSPTFVELADLDFPEGLEFPDDVKWDEPEQEEN